MKTILLRCAILFILCVPMEAFGQRPCTTTVSGERNAVALAVQKASDGDVICLTAGMWTWDYGIDISREGTIGLEIRGAGNIPQMGSAKQTTIRVGGLAPGGGQILGGYEVQFPRHHNTIDNIHFVADVNSLGLNQTDRGLTGFRDIPTQTNPQYWIIHHNDYEVSGRCDAVRFIVAAAKGGLIYRNTFSAEVLPSCNYTNTNLNPIVHIFADDNGSWWAHASTWGNADTDFKSNLYVENNVFHNFNVAIDADNSSRLVWRFNELHNSSIANHGQDSATQGMRHAEIYKNKFICDDTINLIAWIASRGGTYSIWDNMMDRLTAPCSQGAVPLLLTQYRLEACDSSWLGQPGLYEYGVYPSAYPLTHNIGWGWIDGQNMTIPAGLPGTGYVQALEPEYHAGNTYAGSTGPLAFVRYGYIGTCRAMASSDASKTTGSMFQTAQFVSAGQTAFVAFTDLVGGTEPSISDNFGNTWIPVAGGMNGNMRLRGWRATMQTTGVMTVTVNFDNSSAARAGTLVLMRGVNTTDPVDVNPAVVTANASPHVGPATGTLSQSDEIVLGYFALNGPTVSASNTNQGVVFNNDNISVPTPDLNAVGTLYANGLGIHGTTGGDDTSNVTVAVTQRVVGPHAYPNSQGTTNVAPQIVNATASRMGLAGTIAFKRNGTSPDLDTRDFVQADREYYDQKVNFDGSSGAGFGPRSMRPATCIARTAWLATDQGSWNTSGMGGQGVIDRCDGIPGMPGTWHDNWYVPADYPHPLADVIATGNTNFFTQQPTNTNQGGIITPVVTGSVFPQAPDSLTVSSANCPLTAPSFNTTADSMGHWTFAGLGLQAGAAPVTGCILKVHDNTNPMIADIMSNPFTMTGTITVTVEPTNVLSGSIISPPVQVTLTPPAPGAALSASISPGGGCGLAGDTMTTSTTFSNLIGTTIANGCTLRIENTSNSAYVAATSNAFNVTSSLSFGSDFTNNAGGAGTIQYAPTCRSGKPSVNGTLTAITAQIDRNLGSGPSGLLAAIYTDSGGRPQSLIARSADPTTDTAVGYHAVQILMPVQPPISLTANETYWLCVRDLGNQSGLLYSSVTDPGNGFVDNVNHALPGFATMFPSGVTATNRAYFIGGNYSPNAPSSR